jgi:hypothetical protein
VSQIRRLSGAKCTVSDYSRGAVERILTVSGPQDLPPGWRSPHEYEPSSTRPVGADQKPLGRPGKLWIQADRAASDQPPQDESSWVHIRAVISSPEAATVIGEAVDWMGWVSGRPLPLGASGTTVSPWVSLAPSTGDLQPGGSHRDWKGR